MTQPIASARVRRAVLSVVETLEGRRLLAGDPFAYQAVVQPLPYSLDFTGPVNGVFDAAGQGTGFTRLQTNRLGTQYQQSLIHLNTSAGELDLTTQGTSTTGSNYGTDNTLVNALETQFDGTTSGFTLTARLKGPLSQMNAPYYSGGVYFGPDQDNYVKLVAEYDGTKGQTLQFVDEQSGTIHTVNLYQSIGSFAAVNTLDLRLTGDAATGQITGSYSVNGGAFVTLSTPVTLTGAKAASFFTASARGGILALSKNNLPPVTIAFSHFEIDPGARAASRPSVTTTSPGNSDMNVSRAAFISADLSLPNAGIDETTLNSSTVFLYRTSDHALVPAVVNTSGGGDTIILQPSGLLDANTTYTFTITNGVKDTTGATMAPFTMNFTTGTAGGATDPSIAFSQTSLSTATGVPFTCVRIGPDHQLYASSEDGRIFRYPINADGTLGTPQVITSLQTANGGQRLISGFAFDPASTAANPIIWVTHGYYATLNAPDWSCKITRMSGPDLATVQDAVVNLPRSIRDHLTEQPTFGPDGALYFGQGSNTAMGEADSTWGGRHERLLTAAILRLDTSKINFAQPLDVKTADGGGTYDPYAAGAPLTLYATGVRNAFQLLWTSDGILYAPTNGSSAGGNTPAGPNAPALTNVQQTEQDWIFKIQQGGYYGHPDALRNEFVLDGGNPTANVDPEEITAYPVGTQPDPNYRGTTPGAVYDLGAHRSPDGIIEYQDHTFGGAMQGKLFVAEYSGGSDIAVLTRDASGNIISAERGITGLTDFTNPVNLVEDNVTGNIYVAELGGQKLTLLKPIPPHATATPNKTVAVFNDVQTSSSGGAGPSPSQNVTITNTGTMPLAFPANAFTIGNDPSAPTQDAASFSITNLGSLPASVAPGQSVNVTLNFTASSTGIKYALLKIQSNDAANPLLTIALHGIGTTGSGGGNEPSLARILRAYNIPTIVGDGPNDSNQSSTFYPNPPDASSQELPMQRLVKAGDGPVTIQTLATFVVPNQPGLRFGYYTPGSSSSKTELFTINKADSQSVNPTPIGATSFDPGSSAFGLYSVFPTFTDNGKQRVAYSEDALNTWDTAVSRKIRFFPLENADGSVVPNAYVFTAEDYNLQYDSNDIVGIIRNVTAAPNAPHGPVLGVENLDVLPSNDRMIFNRVQNPDPTFGNIVHDTGTLRLRNTGDQPLVINSISLSSPAWTVVNAPTTPLTIAAGGTYDLTVKFIATTLPPHSGNQTNDSTSPNGGGVYNGILTINSNDPAQLTRSVTLAGYWQNRSENEEEPGVNTIINLLAGYGTNIAPSNLTDLPEGSTPTYYGEEVVSSFWQQVDASQPVTVRQLDAYHQVGDPTTGQLFTAFIGWYAKGSTGTNKLFTHAVDEAQMLLPHLSGSSTAPAQGSFNASGSFGWNLDGNYSEDSRNTVGGGGGHHVRFYPLRDSSGNVIANSWIALLDYGSSTFENYDFQDNAYIITNMKPEALPATPASAQATGSTTGVALQWAAVNDSSLVGYNVYRSSSPTGTFTKLNTSPLSAASYADTTAASGVTSYYRITAVNAAGESVGANASARPVPAAPSNLVAQALSAGSIKLTWSASSGATTYRIEREAVGDSAFVEIATGVTATTFTDIGLRGGTNYVYQIRAENGSGLSPYSSIAVAKTAAGVAPGAPSAPVAGTISSTQITFSWAAASGTVTNYHIERKGPADASFVEVANVGNVLSYTDSSVSPSTAYQYRVRGENAGAFGAYSAATTITSAVAAPSNLTASAASTTQINLAWTASAGSVTGYRIERMGQSDAGFIEIASAITGTTYQDSTAAAGATYAYRVRAQGSAGLSDYSNSASAATPRGVPAAPTGLTAAPISSGQVLLNWTTSSDAASYRIERLSPSGAAFVEIASGISTSTYTDTTVASGSSYSYRIRAQNAAGLSDYGNTATAATPQPVFQSQDINAPLAGSTTVNADGSSYDVSASGADIGGNADGFRFLYQLRTGDFDARVQIQSLSQIAPTTKAGLMVRSSLNAGDLMVFTGATASDGNRFSARTAVNAASSFLKSGTSAYPNMWARLVRSGNVFTGYSSTDGVTWTQTGQVTLNLPSQVYFGLAVTSHSTTALATAQLRNYSVVSTPAAPASLAAAGASPTQINLNWSAVSGAASYRVERMGPSDAGYVEIASGLTGTGYADVSASPSTSYSYRVRAQNAYGLSPYSPIATATTQGVPSAPSAPAATVLSPSKITLTWAPSSGSVTDYRVERMGPSDSAFVEIATVTSGTSFADSGLVASTTYAYRVRAENAAGFSDYSGSVSATTQGTPDAPAALSATAAGPTRVTLSWTAPAGSVSAYHIERMGPSDASFIEIAANVTSTSYIDASALANTAYTYRVRAENEAGLGAYSATASATTTQAAFQSADIGASPSGSTTVNNDGTDYDVVAGGPAIYDTADGFRYVYQQRTGDFDVKVQVQSMSVAGAIAQAGLMARESLATNSREASMTASPSNGYRFKSRTATGGTTNVVTTGTMSYPNVWVRLKRVGNVFTGYYSTDGIHWTSAGSVTMALPATVYVGMAVASNDTTDTTTAQLRNFGNV